MPLYRNMPDYYYYYFIMKLNLFLTERNIENSGLNVYLFLFIIYIWNYSIICSAFEILIQKRNSEKWSLPISKRVAILYFIYFYLPQVTLTWQGIGQHVNLMTQPKTILTELSIKITDVYLNEKITHFRNHILKVMLGLHKRYIFCTEQNLLGLKSEADIEWNL